jgi:hypothetical protein
MVVNIMTAYQPVVQACDRVLAQQAGMWASVGIIKSALIFQTFLLFIYLFYVFIVATTLSVVKIV